MTIGALLRPARLVVGPDGILRTWYGRRHFVPWADVVARVRVALEAACDPAVEEDVLDEALARVSRALPGSS